MVVEAALNPIITKHMDLDLVTMAIVTVVQQVDTAPPLVVAMVTALGAGDL